MINLIRAEWLKLSRRPMAWILLAIFLFQVALYLSILFVVIGMNDGILLGGAGSIQVLKPEEIEQFRLQVSFPGVLGDVLGQANGIGGVLAVILAAGAMGSEYNWGTLRVQLARQPDRRRYLFAKVIALLLVVLAGIALALVVGSLLALLFGAVLGNLGHLSVRDLLLLPVGMLRSLFIMLPYLMFTIAISIIGRSIMGGVAGGILLLVLDASAGAPAFLATIEHPLVVFLYNMLLQPNVNTLVVLNRNRYGLDPMVSANLDPSRLPPTWQATLVLALYSLLFLGYAYYVFTRSDISGAT